MIKTKSIYDRPKNPEDRILQLEEGTRILVTRKWPMFVSKQEIHEWYKELGPSIEL